MALQQPEFSQLEKRWIELCRAAYRGDLAAVNNLLKLKVLPSCQDPSHVARPTPLHNAALKGHLDVAKALLDMRKYIKLNVDAKDTYGWTPLHYAVSQKRTEMVEYLIRRGASPNARTERKIQGVDAQSSPGDMAIALGCTRIFLILGPMTMSGFKQH